MSDFYFEDFRVGDVCRTISRTITEADLAGFVGLTGFFEEVFVSVPRALTGHHFDRRLIPGPMTYVFAEGLFILTGRMHRGIAYLGIDELRLTAPVGCGDTIQCEIEVVEARPSKSKPGGVVRCSHRVLNQDGIQVLTYGSSRIIEYRPTPTDSDSPSEAR